MIRKFELDLVAALGVSEKDRDQFERELSNLLFKYDASSYRPRYRND